MWLVIPDLLLVLHNTHGCVPVIDIKHKQCIHNYNSLYNSITVLFHCLKLHHFFMYIIFVYIYSKYILLVNLYNLVQISCMMLNHFGTPVQTINPRLVVMYCDTTGTYNDHHPLHPFTSGLIFEVGYNSKGPTWFLLFAYVSLFTSVWVPSVEKYEFPDCIRLSAPVTSDEPGT